jgi:hypothetical protein
MRRGESTAPFTRARDHETSREGGLLQLRGKLQKTILNIGGFLFNKKSPHTRELFSFCHAELVSASFFNIAYEVREILK